MADNGKIIRNGAEIQIDENGNVVARPAAGQEFIVEDDARVGTLEADSANVTGTTTTEALEADSANVTGTTTTEALEAERHHILGSIERQVIDKIDSTGTTQIPSEFDGFSYLLIEGSLRHLSSSTSSNQMQIRLNGQSDSIYDYVRRDFDTFTTTTADDRIRWETNSGGHRTGHYFYFIIPRNPDDEGVRCSGSGGHLSVVECIADIDERVDSIDFSEDNFNFSQANVVLSALNFGGGI